MNAGFRFVGRGHLAQNVVHLQALEDAEFGAFDVEGELKALGARQPHSLLSYRIGTKHE